MSGPRVLVVSKRTALERWSADEVACLDAIGAQDRRQLEEAHAAHHRCLGIVHQQLHHCRVDERQVDVLDAQAAAEADLIVTVGGDGTVLACHALLNDTPVISVNSDPHRSVGHYTRIRAETVAALVEDWLAGRAAEERCHRLRLHIVDLGSGRMRNGAGDLILNDALFTNANPAAMTRYRLHDAQGEEVQAASGVWISTATGASGAIASAGAAPPPPGPVLLYLVREPFFGHRRFTRTSGCQAPPQQLQLTPTIPGICCYLDGAHLQRPIPPGCAARFVAADQPLRLLTVRDQG